MYIDYSHSFIELILTQDSLLFIFHSSTSGFDNGFEMMLLMDNPMSTMRDLMERYPWQFITNIEQDIAQNLFVFESTPNMNRSFVTLRKRIAQFGWIKFPIPISRDYVSLCAHVFTLS